MKASNANIDMLFVRDGRDESISTNEVANRIRDHFSRYTDTELQACLLEKVSRTFALTIPELPPDLAHVVSNAYLLCRIIDTVEDEPILSASQKKKFCDRFIRVVKGTEDTESFIHDLVPLLSKQISPGEYELIMLADRIIHITHQFETPQRRALERCISSMADGMVYFQKKASPDGLENLKEVDKYCYHVAGVVGEMLTELFCLYSTDIAKNRDQMMELAVSFGQGLQMTNILKDLWEDYERAACWLPKDYFEEGLENLSRGESTESFQKGVVRLVGITHAHLYRAVEYTLLIPSKEKGIRRFCSWAIGMAVLTLQKIYKKPGFTNGEQVKISRNTVKTIILLTNSVIDDDRMLKMLFNLARRGLPHHQF